MPHPFADNPSSNPMKAMAARDWVARRRPVLSTRHMLKYNFYARGKSF
jgi:hypothetical protein